MLVDLNSLDGKYAEATTSLAGDLDEDESYVHSPLRLGDMPMSHPDPDLVSPRTSKNTCSPPGESSTSQGNMSLVGNESVGQQKGSIGKHNVLNAVGSVLHAFAIVGLGSKETNSRGNEAGQATVPGSMLGRHRVTSMKSIRRSNPGLGWLSNSMQSE